MKIEKLHSSTITAMNGIYALHSDGSKCWSSTTYKNGSLIRTNTVVIKPDGVKEWRQNGFLHREDGPAVNIPSNSNGRQDVEPLEKCDHVENPISSNVDN